MPSCPSPFEALRERQIIQLQCRKTPSHMTTWIGSRPSGHALAGLTGSHTGARRKYCTLCVRLGSLVRGRLLHTRTAPAVTGRTSQVAERTESLSLASPLTKLHSVLYAASICTRTHSRHCSIRPDQCDAPRVPSSCRQSTRGARTGPVRQPRMSRHLSHTANRQPRPVFRVALECNKGAAHVRNRDPVGVDAPPLLLPAPVW